MAEAPGPWGCRFSGVPLVSEQQLLDPAFPLDGRPTSLRALHGEPLKEYSGGIYWRAMEPRWGRFWTWNAVPFHPHKPGEPLTIRAPRAREIRQFADALAAVVEAVQPGRVVALGRVAERALAAVGVESTYVRHPSQGGATAFREGMAESSARPEPLAAPPAGAGVREAHVAFGLSPEASGGAAYPPAMRSAPPWLVSPDRRWRQRSGPHRRPP